MAAFSLTSLAALSVSVGVVYVEFIQIVDRDGKILRCRRAIAGCCLNGDRAGCSVYFAFDRSGCGDNACIGVDLE